MNILLAEDEPDIQIVTRIALEDHGHRVVVVNDGLAAVERALAEPFDVILLDIMMPRLDGCGACRQLKADLRTRDVPVIFMTAHAQEPEMQADVLNGAIGYIIKPFDALTLVNQITALLAQWSDHA